LCTEETGCVHVPQDLLSCSDDFACTSADHCVEGLCVGTPVEIDDYDAGPSEVDFEVVTDSQSRTEALVLGPGPETDWLGYHVT
ncbi:MAG: hypothetical protein QF464_14270, partial [Myxococcota bacterium]|nr:hypothetical protein [Myxococcota bacterium]